MTIRNDDQVERHARTELDELRARVDCRTVLEAGGWELDAKESTRGAVKYRNGAGRIVIVTHEGKGWFDPLNDKRGDALALAQYVWGGNLGHARKALRPLAGIAPRLVPMHQSAPTVSIDAGKAWDEARKVCQGSQGWRYLIETRGLPIASVERAVQAGVLKEGIYGTVWARHQTAQGQITGWEMRGPNFKGFVKGGGKTLFWIGTPATCDRVAVTESFIDALSLASIEGWPDGTVYVSIGGGYGPETARTLQTILPADGRLIAATDQGTGGEVLANRLHELATVRSAEYERLRPEAQDWNVQIRQASTAIASS